MLNGASSPLLLLADFVDEWVGWLPAGLLPEVRNGFAFGYGEASLILTAHLVGGYAGSAVGGLLADFWNRQRLLATGAAVYATGLGVAGLAPNFAVILVACVLIGLASGPVVHTARLMLIDRANALGERLERPLGRFNALSSVGDLAGPCSLALGLGIGFGWRSLFWLGALLMTAYGLGIVAAGAHGRGPRANPGAARRPSLAQVLEALRDPRLLRLALALALLDALDEPFAGFVLLYLRDVMHASAPQANAAIGALVGSTLLGFALAAHLSWSRNRMMQTFLLTMGLALGAFLFAPLLLLKVACLALVGMAGAGFYTAALAQALSLRPDMAGTATAVLSTVGASSLLFPPLVGWIADQAGLGASLLVYAVLPLVMLVLAHGVKPDVVGQAL